MISFSDYKVRKVGNAIFSQLAWKKILTIKTGQKHPIIQEWER